MNTSKLSKLILSETTGGVFGVALMIAMFFLAFAATSSTNTARRAGAQFEAQSELPELVFAEEASAQTATNLPPSTR